jgi:O-antigen ligase
MKKVEQQNSSSDINPLRWIFGGLAVITLYFQTNLADPFNSPKMWILFIVAYWLTGYIESFKSIIFANKTIKVTSYLILAFIVFALFSTLFSDNYYISIFGDTYRHNGFLSYLSLAIVMLATTLFVRTFNIKQLYAVAYIVATVTAIYAFMQTSGNDFVEWNNNYNSIIGTLGNPNFAAALMAVIGVLIFSSIFISDFKNYIRFFGVVLAIALLVLIYKSNARQGLLSYILGIGLFLIIWLLIKRRSLGLVAIGGGVLIFIISVLGMLQFGPLERFLYKPSVSVRGYYWRAGIEMLKQNPLFGVGMDRYGAYFKEFREVGYSMNYGFDLTSSNAHNTFIQLFATGGIFFGASYLILNGYILKKAIFGLKNLGGNNQLLLAGVFSAWMAFHAQSLVSIDNIGISIWGWVLGGSIIGLSVSASSSLAEDRKPLIGRRNHINLRRVSTSTIATIIPVILITFLYRGEVNTYKAAINYDLQDQTSLVAFKDLQIKAANTPLVEYNYALSCGFSLIRAGLTEEGIEIFKKIHKSDPRNLDAINSLILTYESYNKIPDAIIYRNKMALLDPWNAVNYLVLAKNYELQGDLINSKAMVDKILSFATGPEGSPIAEQAKKVLA